MKFDFLFEIFSEFLKSYEIDTLVKSAIVFLLSSKWT